MSRPDGYLLPGSLSPDAIVVEVARGFRVSVDDIMGTSREQHILVARACAMAVIRTHTNWSWQRMAGYFGRYHQTVQQAVAKVMNDPELGEAVRLVAEELRGDSRGVIPENPYGSSPSDPQADARIIEIHRCDSEAS